MNRKILLFSVFFLVTISMTVSAPVKHGIWVVRYALKNDNVDEIISVSRSLEITDLYVQVWALSKNYYKNNDYFKILIKKAHLNNIKVHAWLNVLYIWSGNGKPQITNTSYKSLLRKNNSIPKYKDLRSKGIEGFYIHPLDHANIENLSGMIDELINVYHVDGIHLDYFRYPDYKYSISPTGRTRFMLKYYYDPYKTLFINNNKLTGENSFVYEQYKTFLKDELTEALKQIKKRIIKTDKKIELSIAVKPDPNIADTYYFQNWQKWIAENICDYVILMNYNADNIVFKSNLFKAIQLNNNKKIVIGIATYNQSWTSFTEKYKLAMNTKLAGTSIFSYNYLSENIDFYNKIKATIGVTQ